VSPYQLYAQSIYDKDLQEVIDVETTWFQYKTHWIPSKRRRFVCSAGPHLREPCYGEAIRQQHWDKRDEIEERTGTRPEKSPPVGATINFGLGITVMETVYAVPVRNSDGTYRKSRRGQVIKNMIPAPFVELEEGQSFGEQFGHKMHWSLNLTNLDYITDKNEELRNACATCTGDLWGTHIVCPDCENTHALPAPVKRDDLTALRYRSQGCADCGYKGMWVLTYACPDCGEPEEGGITKFDIRVKRIKSGNNWGLKISEFRKPSEDEELQKLIQNPLGLEKIFAPDSLDVQKKLLEQVVDPFDPERLVIAGLDPSYGAFTDDYTTKDGNEEAIDF
jgi:predicted RNA-binding Zn-ribbon protein involved in translation (DUF1610 family)